MIYFGKLSDTQMHTFTEEEFKNFAKSYPNVDLFVVGLTEIEKVKDRIESNQVVIYYADIPPYSGLDVFFKLFNSHPEKTFLVLTNCPGWKDVAQWPLNVQWIWYNFSVHTHDPNDHIGEYRNLDCLINKNFDSTKIGISLNRLPRSHRLCLLSYMLGIGLDEHCVITAPLLKWHLSLNDFNFDIMNSVSWDFDKHENFKTVMSQGWERAKQSDGLFPVTKDAYPPYDDLEPNQSVFDNPANYVNNLMPFYKNSFVEYIMFSIYDYAIPWICEKILHSQLACNFPIFVAGKGTVEWLRTHEFDVFDDIINHAYDLEDDPVLRMQKLVDDNRDLLQHQKHTKDLLIKHHHRFRYNVDWHITNSDNTFKLGKNLLNEWIIT